ncbi:hypothetical protein [Devosia psychrophila]|uniref:Uncharacterized protein n=2 Tax=Devosia psychrophila TaxID=728005 RepID=A0ABR5E202_9HYPH|nr:hypothetical protein [Devosia psychrophila]KKC34298.1 hypothetical protein WH91_03595 [Devosia psychrophila]
MSWDVAAMYFGLAWIMILPAWSRNSLIVLALFGFTMFPVLFAVATIHKPNSINEYVSLPALLIGVVGLPIFILSVIGKAFSLRLDYRLRQRDRHENNTERLR